MELISFRINIGLTECIIIDFNISSYTRKETELTNNLLEVCFIIWTKEVIHMYETMFEVYLNETGMNRHISSNSFQ